MKKMWMELVLIALGLNLAACSTNIFNQPESNKAVNHANMIRNAEGKEMPANISKPTGGEIGGSIASSMDVIDKGKLNHALDTAPGKVTHWVSENNGTDYTVEPIKKVTVDGNSFCREYHITAVKDNNKRDMNGTACVGPDGAWHAVSG